jgi:hypothetical protein
MVELEPSKLVTRVRFPSPAPLPTASPAVPQAGLGTGAKAESLSQRGTARRAWAGPWRSRAQSPTLWGTRERLDELPGDGVSKLTATSKAPPAVPYPAGGAAWLGARGATTRASPSR